MIIIHNPHEFCVFLAFSKVCIFVLQSNANMILLFICFTYILTGFSGVDLEQFFISLFQPLIVCVCGYTALAE